MSEPSTLTRTAALKEWALVCRLLLEGRQSILLRKGGIDEKGFWVEAPEFYLFPTYLHQNRERVRREYVTDFDEAITVVPAPGILRIDGFVRVAAAIEVRRSENIAAIEDLHPYNREQVAMRLEFRPRKPLVILVAETHRLRQPIEHPMLEEFAGCLSWVSLDLRPPEGTRAVVARDRIEEITQRVREAVG